MLHKVSRLTLTILGVWFAFVANLAIASAKEATNLIPNPEFGGSFCQKTHGTEHLLMLVNVIDRPVSFYLKGFPQQVTWLSEIFKQQKSVVLDGNIREELGPYEVRIYRYRQGA